MYPRTPFLRACRLAHSQRPGLLIGSSSDNRAATLLNGVSAAYRALTYASSGIIVAASRSRAAKLMWLLPEVDYLRSQSTRLANMQNDTAPAFGSAPR